MTNRRQVKDMADRLISTLADSMPSEKADAIVRDVAEELYREVLGIPGHIIVDQDKPMGWVHTGGSRGHRKAVHTFAEYKFQPDGGGELA